MAVPAHKLALYEKLVATQPEVDRKGAKNPYTSRNGHMFSFLTQEGMLALRLSPEDLETFREKYRSGPVEAYGATMRGYSSVPASLLKKTGELERWFRLSYDYIGTLKPKPATRKKKAKK